MDAVEGGQTERRIERVQFETDRQRVVGNVTLPLAGYQSRFSDAFNRPDMSFIPLVDVEISSLSGEGMQRLPFLVLSKAHVRVAFPVDAAS
jgi:hypothetical protein